MKANYVTVNRKQVEKLTEETAKKIAFDMRNEIQDNIERDVMYQTIAVVFWTLHKHFGFGATRLQKLKNLTEDEFKFMIDGVLGKKYSPRDCENWLLSIGIDLDKSQYK